MTSESFGVTLQWHEGDVVRKLRAAAGWKLKQLADASGVNIQVIHRLESGVTKEARRATLARIARAFGLSERQLLDAIPAPCELPIRVQQNQEPPNDRRKRSGQ